MVIRVLSINKNRLRRQRRALERGKPLWEGDIEQGPACEKEPVTQRSGRTLKKEG